MKDFANRPCIQKYVFCHKTSDADTNAGVACAHMAGISNIMSAHRAAVQNKSKV